MQQFHHILFVSRGVMDETEALKQALSLARNNQARLKALIVCPDLPKEMAEYREKYETSLKDQLARSIEAARDAVHASVTDVPVPIEIEDGDTPAIRIIRHVLQGGHDLVIKAAEPKESGPGFKAIDMELLRKCPCPVWLTRPIGRHHDSMRLAVAIDPQSKAPEGHDLSLRLLAVARALADTCDGELRIVSCWDYEFEQYLRRNAWMQVPDHELTQMVQDAQNNHRAALEELVRQSGVQGKLQVHQARGAAEQMIPHYVADEKIDILVMGTVARTGIPGFFIGNTAENTVQKLSCSLLALKPNGFVSPVKAYP